MHRSRLILSSILLLSLVGPAAEGQDAYPVNVVGELVNFETPIVDPLLATADGLWLVVAHEPDERLIVLDAVTLEIEAEVVVGLGPTALAERPGGGEIWVSVAFSSAVVVVETSGWTVTDVLRPPDEGILGDGATPAGIAFSADGTKAWVVASTTDVLLVYDAEQKVWTKTVDLSVVHNGVAARVQEPRAIVRHGDELFVAVFRSGNQSAAGPFEPLGHFSEVLDLEPIPGVSLPDADVLVLSAVDETVLRHISGVGTLIYGLAVDATNNRLLVANMDSLNREFVGERAFPSGRMTLNRLSLIDLAPSPEPHLHVALEDLPGPAGPVQVAMPTNVVLDDANRVYVSGYASATIAAFDDQGAWLGSFPTDDGPRGLAVSPDGRALYSYNRMASTVTVYDLTQPPTGPIQTVELFDPTYDDVAAGRRLFHSAALSGGESTGCFSCHPDARQDGLGWELSTYQDAGDGFSPDNPPRFWDDRKFIMTSQDCRSLEDTAPYHWRGERKELAGFNGAFEELLKGEQLAVSDFAKIEAYLFHTVYPANPFMPNNRQHSELAELGRQGFTGELTCFRCHALPAGSSGTIADRFRIGMVPVSDESLFGTHPPHLRGIWTKLGDLVNLRGSGAPVLTPIGGFGLNRNGSHRDVRQFLRLSFPDFPVSDYQRLEAFVHELDSGIAPAANGMHWLSQETLAAFPGPLLIGQANAGSVDLVARGRIDLGAGWQPVGMVFDSASQRFVTDGEQPPLAIGQLVSLAQSGAAELLVMGVPVGSGERLGVDRDRDGLFDALELAAGTEPANPDTDGDGFWDSYDDDPLVASPTVSIITAPEVRDLEVLYTTSNGARVVYTTNTFSPTHVVYGKTESYGATVGDPLELPAGSNHWRRRHSVMLSGLEDDENYHFRVLTRGQNGVEGSSSDHETLSRWDTFHLIWAESISLELTSSAGVTTATATLQVVDNEAASVAGAEVHGILTLFRAGEPFAQLDVDGGPSDSNGTALIEVVLDSVLPGDEVEFFLPMYQGGETIDAPAGLEPPDGRESFFAWAENVETHARATVPALTDPSDDMH